MIAALAATLALSGAPVPAPLPVLGDALNKAWVAADARWVVHVDVAGILNSSLGRQIMKRAQAGDFDVDWSEYEEFKREFGIDPLRELRSVTVYGSKGEEDAVALIATSANLDALFARVAEEEEVEWTDVDGVHMRRVDDAAIYVHSLGGNERVVVAAENAGNVARAARVLSGAEKNLLQSSQPAIVASPRPSAFVFFAAADLDAFDELDFDSHTFGNARGLSFELGESGGRVFASATLDAGNTDDARAMAEVVQGLKALLSLTAGSEDIPPAAIEMLKSIRIDTSGSNVSVSLEVDVRAVLDGLEQLDEHDGHGRHHDHDDHDDHDEYDEF